MLAGKIGYFRASAHPEAADWRTRVIANGGSVSASTFTAVETFCKAIDAAGIRNRFYRLNLFCGTGLAAALVPLYRGQSLGGTQFGGTTETNNNLVAADYVETGSTLGGLKGDGTSKYLDTGVNLSTIGASPASVHLSAYVRGTEASGTSRYMMSAFSGGSGGPGLGWLGGGSNERYHSPSAAGTVVVNGFTSARDGFLCGSTGSASTRYYRNGSLAATAATGGGGAFSNFNVMVLAAATVPAPNAALYSLARYFRAYSIGLDMTDAQWSSYNTAMQAFQTSLTRNV